jgi:hypothetical protein
MLFQSITGHSLQPDHRAIKLGGMARLSQIHWLTFLAVIVQWSGAALLFRSGYTKSEVQFVV